MTRRIGIIAALALPLLGLLASASWHGWRQAGASEWRIPVTGYDPRDLLAGHYARFRLAWTVERAAPQCRSGGCVFCMEERGGTVFVSLVPSATRCANRVDPDASAIDVSWAASGSAGMPQASGRIYIPEGDADRITRLLAENGATLIARLGKGDQLVVVRIEPLS